MTAGGRIRRQPREAIPDVVLHHDQVERFLARCFPDSTGWMFAGRISLDIVSMRINGAGPYVSPSSPRPTSDPRTQPRPAPQVQHAV